MSIISSARHGLAGAAILLVVACGQSADKQNQAAYEACLKSAQADARLSKAAFAKFEEVRFGASTGEEEIRVNIPYTLDGKSALFQCIAQKQGDGSFKVVF